MMPLGDRTRRQARMLGKLLVLIVLLVSPRAILQPAQIVHKSQDSKRPKAPKNVVRAEPVRVPTAEKQSPTPTRPHAVAEELDAGLSGMARIQELPRRTLTQLTRPEYLQNHFAAHGPHSPPA